MVLSGNLLEEWRGLQDSIYGREVLRSGRRIIQSQSESRWMHHHGGGER